MDSFAWVHSKGKAKETQRFQELLNRRHAEGYEPVHMNTIPAGTMRRMHEQTSYAANNDGGTVRAEGDSPP